ELVLLPGAQTGLEHVAPQLLAVRVDVLLAWGGQGECTPEGAVGAARVFHLHVVAAEVVPRGGILVLLISGDRSRQDVLRRLQHAITRVGLGRRALQVYDGRIDAEMARLDVAGRLRRDPRPRLPGDGRRHYNEHPDPDPGG